MAVIVSASVTKLPPSARGAVLLTGSHGGRFAGSVALAARVRAAVFHDAGLAMDDSGVASLPMFDALGVPAAAVGHETARIGDADDMRARGRLTRVNAAARALGVRPGMACDAALTLLEQGSAPTYDPPRAEEARSTLDPPGSRLVLLVDSASLVSVEGDRGAIVVTGSHGGLVGGDPAAALRTDAFAAVFHDAGIGIDQAGIGRLPPLDDRGIAALVADGMTCRIGDARSVYETGIVSACNEAAGRLGARPGLTVRELVQAWSG